MRIASVVVLLVGLFMLLYGSMKMARSEQTPPPNVEIVKGVSGGPGAPGREVAYNASAVAIVLVAAGAVGIMASMKRRPGR